MLWTVECYLAKYMIQDGEIIINKPSQNGGKMPKVLLKVYSAFPFDLIRDVVTIDEDKVSVTVNDFFNTKRISSVLLEDISHVDVTSGVFTATVHIVDSTNPRAPIEIYAPNLSVKDAIKVRNLVQGLIAIRKHGVKLDSGNSEYLKEIEKLGTTEDLKFVSELVKMDTKITHYYGDFVRILFITAAIIMLLTLPFYHLLIPFPPTISILAILGIAFLAGSMSPKFFVVAMIESVVSIGLFILFENTALNYFISGANQQFAVINQTLALLFLISIYYSIKTIRGFLIRKKDEQL